MPQLSFAGVDDYVDDDTMDVWHKNVTVLDNVFTGCAPMLANFVEIRGTYYLQVHPTTFSLATAAATMRVGRLNTQRPNPAEGS